MFEENLNDITMTSFMKFKYKSTKGISKRHTKFHFDGPYLGELRSTVGKLIGNYEEKIDIAPL